MCDNLPAAVARQLTRRQYEDKRESRWTFSRYLFGANGLLFNGNHI